MQAGHKSPWKYSTEAIFYLFLLLAFAVLWAVTACAILWRYPREWIPAFVHYLYTSCIGRWSFPAAVSGNLHHGKVPL